MFEESMKSYKPNIRIIGDEPYLKQLHCIKRAIHKGGKQLCEELTQNS